MLKDPAAPGSGTGVTHERTGIKDRQIVAVKESDPVCVAGCACDLHQLREKSSVFHPNCQSQVPTSQISVLVGLCQFIANMRTKPTPTPAPK